MKHITKLFAIVVAVIGFLAFTAPVHAQLTPQKTFWSVTSFTNNPGTVTNLAAAIDVTQVADFSLEVLVNTTNPPSGSLDIVWDTSLNGSNYSPATNANLGRVTGWFSVPLTNNNTRNYWLTNITVDSVGYWRIRAITNSAGQHITNITVRGYIKPMRTRSDY